MVQNEITECYSSPDLLPLTKKNADAIPAAWI